MTVYLPIDLDFQPLSRYKNMSDALLATGRPILYRCAVNVLYIVLCINVLTPASMCNWGDDGPWNWATVRSLLFGFYCAVWSESCLDRPLPTPGVYLETFMTYVSQ
jgi:hypothetical protein